jgi:hypothetical protein
MTPVFAAASKPFKDNIVWRQQVLALTQKSFCAIKVVVLRTLRPTLRAERIGGLLLHVQAPTTMTGARRTKMSPTDGGTWVGDWAWSLPLIVLTVVIHVCGLALIAERVVGAMNMSQDRGNFMLKFALVMGGTALLATLLHGIEASI